MLSIWVNSTIFFYKKHDYAKRGLRILIFILLTVEVEKSVFFFQFNYLTSTESSSPLFRKENIALLENNGLRIKDCTVASMFTSVHSIHNPHLLPIIYMMRTSKFLIYANWLDLAPLFIFKHCNSVFFKTVYTTFFRIFIGCICVKAIPPPNYRQYCF